jgi:hypothetical protein
VVLVEGDKVHRGHVECSWFRDSGTQMDFGDMRLGEREDEGADVNKWRLTELELDGALVASLPPGDPSAPQFACPAR